MSKTRVVIFVVATLITIFLLALISPEVASKENTSKDTAGHPYLVQKNIVPQKINNPEPTPIKVSLPSDECLNILWGNESGWQAGRINISSHAVGIPQALPPTKIYPNYWSMEKVWINGKYYLKYPDKQREIEWGLQYIKNRYGTPCNALYFWRYIAPTYDFNNDGVADGHHWY